ncbi:ion channel [Xinfangfangia sp. CPCC 101601]|uniref:Ion channel n=1 Tax=Pseudogemmobacter lacusdianii TaxID=3069608 RepID=A0ABU0VW44_9RHOB|nr:ion channel [Xinfangfangia sp. CPCC 101601]MDQ2065981.1 ion channel [Xinfangfangia sp. CPCC 101601]
MTLRSRLHTLYEGAGAGPDRFRYALLAFDLATVCYLVSTSFLPRGPYNIAIDLCIGFVFLADLLARLLIARRPLRELFSFWGIADLLVILSLLFPIWGEGLAFLRVLRLYRVLHSPRTISQLGRDIPGFRRNEATLRAGANLLIFLFATTALVYQTQSNSNPDIANYIDALYFTVTTLTTTGFGDVTLTGHAGRLLTVAIMIVGVSLFLRLVQVALRPSKAHFPCPKCGLRRHDHDAVHCKACGTLINIPDDGLD